MKVTLIERPDDNTWMEVKRRALVTVGMKPVNPPTLKWKEDILKAKHSPIRYIRFSFLLEDIPYWVSVHLCRHIHAQPYVKTQRNDRQNKYDRNTAPQNSPVTMIYDVNAEELMTIANKRLCNQASEETHQLVQMMVDEVLKENPEFKFVLVPNCIANGGICPEMYGCGLCPSWRSNDGEAVQR